MVTARGSLDNSPALLASLPAHADEVFFHRLLLEVCSAISDVWVSSAEGAGAAPAGPAEAYVRELVHIARRDVFAALAVAAEELALGGIVGLAQCDKLEYVCREVLSDLGALHIHLPDAAPRGPTLAVLAAVEDELGEAVPAVAVGTGRYLLGGVATDDAVVD